MSQATSLVSLADVVKPTRPKVKPSNFPDLPFIGLEHVEAHTSRLLDTVPAHTMKSAAVHFQPGDVLYSRLRPYLNKVVLPDFEGLCSSEFIVLPPNGQITGPFLKYLLNSWEFVQFANSLNAGVRPRVDFGQIGPYTFLLPPREKQEHIIDAIETQFARLDDTVAALERARTRLKRYRASVLKAACEGRLVPTEDANWPVQLLGQHIEQIQAGKNVRCIERPPTMDEVGIVKISAVTWGEFDEQESKTCNDVSVLRDNLLIQPGDFLISRANTIELVGACVIVRDVSLPVMLSDKVLRITFGLELDQRWVLHFLQSIMGRHEIESRATGNQNSMRNIGQNRIKEIPIPVPPIETQHEIIGEIERSLSVVVQLGATVETSLKRAKALRQSILRLAFSGHLV